VPLHLFASGARRPCLPLCVCVCVCVAYTHTYSYMYAYIYVYIYAYIYAAMHVYSRIYARVYVLPNAYTYAYTHAYTYAYMHHRTRIRAHICKRIWKYHLRQALGTPTAPLRGSSALLSAGSCSAVASAPRSPSARGICVCTCGICVGIQACISVYAKAYACMRVRCDDVRECNHGYAG